MFVVSRYILNYTKDSLLNKAILFSFFFLLIPVFLSASEWDKANIWYFGYRAGIDFNTNPPTVISGETSTDEGTSVACDDNGQLLFYTDGVTVWNRNHQVMKHGVGLLGDFYAAQSAIILPELNDKNKCYIFTVDLGDPNKSSGLNYSIVDLNAEGGSGEIVSKNNFISKNITEGMTSTKHANDEDYWLITHGHSNNSFYVYKITEDGIQLPIESKVGRELTDIYDRLAYTKVSPTGDKIVQSFYTKTFIQIFDFDNSTGEVSNPKTISADELYWGYSFEFSPNEEFLYTSSRSNPSFLMQFDVSLENENDINNSKEIIATDNEQFLYGSLQLAPDGKIYHAKSQKRYLGVINDPDNKGLACNYEKQGFDLGQFKSGIGLPNFVQNIVAPPPCLNSFEYADFSDVNGLNLIGSSKQTGDFIRLTEAVPSQRAAVWNKEDLPIIDGFGTEFSFRMSEPHNSYNDGSIPGSDGVCFIIHYKENGLNSLGESGGGIGYSGIENCLVIEFDTYRNYLSDIMDYDGNHVAVFGAKDKALLNHHDTQYNIATQKLPFDLRPDGTQYFVKIDYKNENNDLRIFIDTTKSHSTPMLTISDFDITSYMSLYEDVAAYVGITTATGDSWEIHDLLDWKFCSYTDYLYTSVDEEIMLEEKQLIYPNPVEEYLNISSDFGRINQIYIYDLNGRLVLKANSTNQLFVGNLAKGYYMCVVKKSNKTITIPMIKY